MRIGTDAFLFIVVEVDLSYLVMFERLLELIQRSNVCQLITHLDL